ncbi:hypothetical protein KBD59_02230 [Candidatus Gracilibacteria bacterium]|nr:hypothetical protein [Candidatus Gracilibacteria bacterium]
MRNSLTLTIDPGTQQYETRGDAPIPPELRKIAEGTSEAGLLVLEGHYDDIAPLAQALYRMQQLNCNGTSFDGCATFPQTQAELEALQERLLENRRARATMDDEPVDAYEAWGAYDESNDPSVPQRRLSESLTA